MLRTHRWLLLLVAFVLAGGSGCDEPPVGETRGDFDAEREAVDFGRVLEGETVARWVRVRATGRASVTVSASVRGGPFSLSAGEVDVPGSGSTELEVRFLAGSAPVEGVLVLSAGGRTEEVVLRGEGVRPLRCVPSAQCRESRFELEPGVCVESVSPDGTACIPGSRCQANGRCQSGVCVGSPRSCDDGNPCTRDACAPDVGCVTSPVACPVPANPCRVGVCDRETGCTEVDAQDLTVCGEVDCVSSRVCLSGACQEVPTPEGTLCAPATPCQGEGRCGGGQCVRPDAGELVPAFVLELGGEPSTTPGGPVLLSHAGALFTSLCGGDAGCRLVSYTDNGLLRFETPYKEGGPRTLLAVSDAGVVLHEPGALASYASGGMGAPLWRLPLERLAPPEGTEGLVPSTGPGRTALGAEGEVVALVSWEPSPDAGVDGGTEEGASLVVLAPDGGVLREGPVEGFSGPARVALDERGGLFLFAEGGPLARAEPEDGGPGFHTVPLLAEVPDAGASLAAAGGWLLAGARAFVDADGGVSVARAAAPLDEPVLLLDDTGYTFSEALVLRALGARDGVVRWEVPLLEAGASGTLHEAALLQGGAVGTLSSEEREGLTRAWVRVLARGERLLECPLPGTPRVVGASFSGSLVHVMLERGGAWWLEAFELGAPVSAETRGWPQRQGLSGSRRARP